MLVNRQFELHLIVSEWCARHKPSHTGPIAARGRTCLLLRSPLFGVREEQLLALDPKIGDRFLPLVGDQPIVNACPSLAFTWGCLAGLTGMTPY